MHINRPLRHESILLIVYDARELTEMRRLAPALFKHILCEVLEAFDEHVIPFYFLCGVDSEGLIRLLGYLHTACVAVKENVRCTVQTAPAHPFPLLLLFTPDWNICPCPSTGLPVKSLTDTTDRHKLG
jgi:hypothetical protein